MDTKQETVWNRPEPLGRAAATMSFGTIAAPLLAGFSLTTIVELVGRAQRGLRGDLAIVAFAAAAGLLVFAIQAALTAAFHQVSPADRIAWTPECRTDPVWMEWVRTKQWRDEQVARRHRGSARGTYNLGILAFLLGVVAVLIPEPGGWTWPRVLALVIGGLAVASEVVLVTGWPNPLRRLMSPSSGDLEAEDKQRQQETAPKISGQKLQNLLFDQGGNSETTRALSLANTQIAAINMTTLELRRDLRSYTEALQTQSRPAHRIGPHRMGRPTVLRPPRDLVKRHAKAQILILATRFP
jgi:hypothetical protein